MVTVGIDFSQVNQMGSYLIFDMQIKRCCDNDRSAQGYFRYTGGLCTDKRFVCIAPAKEWILKLNIRNNKLLWSVIFMSFGS